MGLGERRPAGRKGPQMGHRLIVGEPVRPQGVHADQQHAVAIPVGASECGDERDAADDNPRRGELYDHLARLLVREDQAVELGGNCLEIGVALQRCETGVGGDGAELQG